jgi:transcriptional regulator with XRE-family HTH domain
MQHDANHIGRKIARLRYQKGWTQNTLVARLQIQQCNITRDILANIELRRCLVTDIRSLYPIVPLSRFTSRVGGGSAFFVLSQGWMIPL